MSTVSRRTTGAPQDSKTATTAVVQEELYDPASIDYPDGGWKPEKTQFKKAISAYVFCTSVIMTLIYLVNEYFDPEPALREVVEHRNYYLPTTAYSILGYYFFLLFSRWIESDSHVLYEQVWACNMAMLWSVVGMLTNRPLMTGMACAMVCIDQLMWYVDIAVALCTGFKVFPIGVASYITWSSTSMMKRITAAHHIWFLPVMLHSLAWELPNYSFIAGAVIMGSSLVTVSRFTTPFHCLIDSNIVGKREKTKEVSSDANSPTIKYKYRVLYLNINTSYAFWKDIKFKFLHVVDHKSPLLMIPFVVLLGNCTMNLACYGLIIQGLAIIKEFF